MAIPVVFRVMVLTYTSILLLTCFSSFILASFCPERQYLNAKLQICMNCTQCKDNTVLLRPCEFHRDTQCGPLIELLKAMDTGNPHRHKHQMHQHQKPAKDEGEIIWRFGDDIKDNTHDSGVNSVEDEPKAAASEVASSEAPFSSTETLVWDWQAIALTSAVFSCILFFLVITLYSLHQARQWRRLKENFEADVEELSARLSLMAAAGSENQLLKEAGITSTSSQDVANYLDSKCVYLEQLLSERKEGDKVGTIPRGNVYIEESNSKGQ
ncbi:tumor necrosis factor receptor superfamily member wengen [Diorhabda carinulata]|uniref:tumor necrosis factor receptor superfamily member wengen n=1 Tax=Diorhabda sublineata TaxID=1163346 RepID=UPI0024E15CCD|nr:tumor necrosis factor receptor superfamily member wengen [Diorhabda sublineata]XP_057670486.1 tumor necrosis factor receptor superfamily member wengen [Diorhabda carinulata]